MAEPEVPGMTRTRGARGWQNQRCPRQIGGLVDNGCRIYRLQRKVQRQQRNDQRYQYPGGIEGNGALVQPGQ